MRTIINELFMTPEFQTASPPHTHTHTTTWSGSVSDEHKSFSRTLNTIFWNNLIHKFHWAATVKSVFDGILRQRYRLRRRFSNCGSRPPVGPKSTFGGLVGGFRSIINPKNHPEPVTPFLLSCPTTYFVRPVKPCLSW